MTRRMAEPVAGAAQTNLLFITTDQQRWDTLPCYGLSFMRTHGYHPWHPTEKPGYFEHLQASVTPAPKRFHVDGFVGDRAAEWLSENAAGGAVPPRGRLSRPPHP